MYTDTINNIQLLPSGAESKLFTITILDIIGHSGRRDK